MSSRPHGVGLARSLRRAGALAGIALVPLALWPWGQNPYGPVKFLALSLAGALAAAGVALEPASCSWLLARRLRLPVLAATAGLAVYALSAATSIDRSVSLWGSYPGYLGVLSLWASVAVGVAAGSEASAGHARTLARTAAVALAAIFAYAVAQRAGADPLTLREGIDASRLRSTLGNPAYLGAFVLLAAPFALRTALADKSRAWRIAGWFVTAGAVFALAGSASRAAWAGALAAVVVWTVLVSASLPVARRNAVIGSAAGAVVALTTTGIVLVPGFAQRVGASWGVGSTVAWRATLWRDSLRVIGERPLLGWGPDTFALAAPKHLAGSLTPAGSTWQIGSAHNLLLDVAAASGVAAAVALLVAFGALLAAVYTRRLHSAVSGGLCIREALGAWGPLLGAGLVGGFVALQLGPASTDLLVVGAVDAGLLAALLARADARTARAVGTPAALRVVLLGASAILVVGALGAVRLVMADSIVGRLAGGGAVTWSAAHAAFGKAQRLAPWEPALFEAEGDAALQAVLAEHPEALEDGALAFERARELSPRALPVRVQAGNLRFATAAQRGDSPGLQRAYDTYLAALALDPDSADALLGAGSTLLQMGRGIEAARYLEDAVAVDPGSAAGWGNLALAYEAIGRTDDAAEARGRRSGSR